MKARAQRHLYAGGGFAKFLWSAMIERLFLTSDMLVSSQIKVARNKKKGQVILK